MAKEGVAAAAEYGISKRFYVRKDPVTGKDIIVQRKVHTHATKEGINKFRSCVATVIREKWKTDEKAEEYPQGKERTLFIRKTMKYAAKACKAAGYDPNKVPDTLEEAESSLLKKE